MTVTSNSKNPSYEKEPYITHTVYSLWHTFSTSFRVSADIATTCQSNYTIHLNNLYIT